MRVRKRVNGLRQFGGGQAAFWINQAEAVAQNIQTRLGLWLGQWFLAPTAGMPWSTEVLGKYTEQTRDATVRAQIHATPGVLAILTYSSSLDRFSRKWTVSGSVSTPYGPTPFTATS